MTDPERALRDALHLEALAVTPGADGLEWIRCRIATWSARPLRTRVLLRLIGRTP